MEESEDVLTDENTNEPQKQSRKRNVSAKMRTAFDDLDVAIYAKKRRSRHLRQRFVRVLRKLCALCSSCGGRLTSAETGVTCGRCLSVDTRYKKSLGEFRAKAKYVNELGKPMVLLRETKMLPVIGFRYDGQEEGWPECTHISKCEMELVLACGKVDAPGMSCPRDCKHRQLAAG